MVSEDFWLPKKEIRELDLSKIEGFEVVLNLQHTNKEGDSQYVNVVDGLKEYEEIFYLSGWVPKVLGDPKEKRRATIKNACLKVHNNGGRDPFKEAKTYKEFFNEEWKFKVLEYRMGGLLGRISGRFSGDLDRADVLVELDGVGELDSMAWGIRAPDEWYSEMYSNKHQFKFESGFYNNMDEAIRESREHFASDDMFGHRYFPVLVWEHGVSRDSVESVGGGAKAHSDPIVSEKYVAIGTRCKESEIDYVIRECYETGGKVAKDRTWDWE